MACQRDANQNRDSRVATALMRRAPSASSRGYPQRNRNRTIRATKVDLGINSATDPEAGNVNEASATPKASKNWSEFSSGSVWNGYPSEAGRAPMNQQQRQRLDEETDGGRRAPTNESRANEVRSLANNGATRMVAGFAQLLTAPYRAGYALRRATMSAEAGEAETIYDACKKGAGVQSRYIDTFCRSKYPKDPDSCIRNQNAIWDKNLRECAHSKASMATGAGTTEADQIYNACLAGISATANWDYNNCYAVFDACEKKQISKCSACSQLASAACRKCLQEHPVPCGAQSQTCMAKAYKQIKRDRAKCKTAYQKMNGSASFDRRAAMMSKKLYGDIETEVKNRCLSGATATHKTNLSNCRTHNKNCVANGGPNCYAVLKGCNKRAKKQLEYDNYKCGRAYKTAMK